MADFPVVAHAEEPHRVGASCRGRRNNKLPRTSKIHKFLMLQHRTATAAMAAATQTQTVEFKTNLQSRAGEHTQATPTHAVQSHSVGARPVGGTPAGAGGRHASGVFALIAGLMKTTSTTETTTTTSIEPRAPIKSTPNTHTRRQPPRWATLKVGGRPVQVSAVRSFPV